MDEPPQGLGAKPKMPTGRLPKLPKRPMNNAVAPASMIYNDDDTPLPFSQHDIDDTTDNKPFLNKQTDSEILIRGMSKPNLEEGYGEQSDDEEPETGQRNADIDIEGEQWLKPVPGRIQKGFDSKQKKTDALPSRASLDGRALPKVPSEETDTVQHKSFVQRKIWTILSPTDNRLSMKLFGSRKGIQKEKRRLKLAGSLIIHPCSKFRFYWDLIMLFLIVFNILALPVVITFFKHDDLSSNWIVFNAIMDTLFQLDVIFNFRTGFMDDHSSERVILEPKKIARHYLKTWFFIDFISAIPMDYIFMIFDDSGPNSAIWEVSRALRFLRFAKLLSLVRLLRLSRLMRFVGQYEQIFNVASAVIRISNLIMIMLLVCHWNGCLQFLVPVIQDFPPYSWVAINRLQNASFWDQYTWSLFKAMSHMLCIGYGRFPPQCTMDVWMTMISMISGATCFALFIGHATNLIQSMDSSARQYREKLKQVEEYMSYHKLPKNMRLKIMDYYEYRYHGKMFDEKQIFSEVSQNLLEDVANYNCRELVNSVPFFQDADPAFVTRTVSLLDFELYQPGDYILQVGTFGDRMFFIQSGIVDIITPEGYVQTTLSDGSYFGEICLMTKLRRTASVKACSYCCLYSLSVDNFFRVLKEYPAMHTTMREVAKVRLGRLGKESEIMHLDEGFYAADKVEKTQVMFKVPFPTSESTLNNASNVSSTLTKPLHNPHLDLEKSVMNKAAKDSERLIRIINIQDEGQKDDD